MPTKYVRETKGGKAISAYVILKAGREVATMLAHFSDSGVCLVNVFQNDNAAKKSAKVAGVPFPSAKESEQYGFQSARAGGYGYDKFTAVLTGLIIDGHKMTDHCGKRLPLPKGKAYFPTGFKPPRGYHLANMVRKDHGDATKGYLGYSDCYRKSGLKYLEGIGYRVIQAI